MAMCFLLLSLTPTGGINIPQLVLLGGMLGVFYFFMIRPQQQRREAHRTFLKNLQKGAMVITIGGIYGKVVDCKDDMVILEIDPKGSKITMMKHAISWDTTQQYQAKTKK